MGNKIKITGDGNIIGDHNAIIKELITTGDVKIIFSGDYQRLREAYLPSQSIFREADLEHFESRAWLEDEIDIFVKQNSNGYFVIEAEAGVGKTAFLAKLVRQFGYVHHFVELAPGQAGIMTGLMNLAAQLCRTYLAADKIEGILETITRQLLGSEDDNLIGYGSLNAATYSSYLYDLLDKVAQKCPGEKIRLVVDGLDIAGTPRGLNVLGLPRVLPDGVFLIVSHRPVPINLDLSPETPCRRIQLTANDKNNLDDMRRYLRKVASRPAIQVALVRGHCTEEWFIEAIIDKCAGVWIYAQYIIREVEKGERAPLDLTSLPNGLPQYYGKYWKKWRKKKDWYGIYLPVLGLLTAARKPICADTLLLWTGIQMREEELHRLLSEKWGDFVTPAVDHCYKFTHTTLYDFCEGIVDEQSLSRGMRNLVEELKQSAIKHAWQIIHRAQDVEMRRDAALTLAKMHWFDTCEKKEAQAENIIVYLNLAGRFLTTSTERDNIVKGLSSILDLQTLPTQYEIQLRVHRAINYGYLQLFDEAASDYQAAWRLIQTQGLVATYLHTAARILLGAGNIDREKGSRINPQKDQPSRTRLLTQARNSYLGAAKLAEEYGQDGILIIVIYTELSWCCALLRDWGGAEQSYHKALEMLTSVKDTQVYKSYKARVLETASLIHWERGQQLLDLQQDTIQTLNAYQTAYDLVKDELDMLEGMLGEINALTIAHINAGDYQMAMSELPDCPNPQNFTEIARDHWSTALELAQAWGLYELAQEAQNRLQ
ncbi:MAG: hypothetical protein JXR84_07925 [Anaerolineae bacterium]|nr:hypothetical protein [Anaerolineae bacterium]